MKPFYILALLILAGITTRCKNHGSTIKNVITENGDNSKYPIFFDKTAPVNDSSDIGIDWKTEKPISEFELNGATKLSYRFELLNDSIAVLSQKTNKVWEEQDRFKFQPWQWIIEDSLVVSNFEIKDFDKDGNEDLLCCVMSNVNGNEWTYIYLNDGKKLTKLYDATEESFYWFKPEYNPKKRQLSSNWFGSAYGHDDECIYKLNGLTTTPVSKHHQERSGKEIIDEYYKGSKGKWKLIKTEIEKFELNE